jgi:hypothetical protein
MVATMAMFPVWYSLHKWDLIYIYNNTRNSHSGVQQDAHSIVKSAFQWIFHWVWNTGKLPTCTIFLGTLNSNICEFSVKVTATFLRGCASWNSRMNVDAVWWSASTLWQRGHGVLELTIKWDGYEEVPDGSMANFVTWLKPVRFLLLGLHEF